LSADTIVPRPSDPQSLNRFSFVRNNPLKYVDPSGHFVVNFGAAAVGAVIGGVVGAAMVAGPQMYQNWQNGLALTTNIDSGKVIAGAATGALVGGAAGLTLGGSLVAASLTSGAIGGATNAVGNAIGQYAANGTVDAGDMAIAAGTGFAAGAVLPIAAPAGVIGAAAVGGTANATQHLLTQVAHGRSIETETMAKQFGVGVVAGSVGGAWSAGKKIPLLGLDKAARPMTKKVFQDAAARENNMRYFVTFWRSLIGSCITNDCFRQWRLERSSSRNVGETQHE
jgi:hypothetical protein